LWKKTNEKEGTRVFGQWELKSDDEVVAAQKREKQGGKIKGNMRENF